MGATPSSRLEFLVATKASLPPIIFALVPTYAFGYSPQEKEETAYLPTEFSAQPVDLRRYRLICV